MESRLKISSIIILTTLCSVVSCDRRVAEGTVIDMTGMRTETLNASDYIEELEYVALETADNCLVGGNPRVYLTGELIVTVDGDNCHAFDRHTGRWLRKIGNKGRGPNDYLSTPLGEVVDERRGRLWLSQEGRLIEYSLADPSAAPRTFPFPPLHADPLVSMGDECWAVAPLNIMGDQPNRIVFYDTRGATDSIPNHDRFTRVGNALNVNPGESAFYRHGDDAYYKNMFNDTLYTLADGTMHPSRVFRTGRSVKALGELRGDMDAMMKEMGGYHLINRIVETDEAMFFTARHGGWTHAYVFDKRQGMLTEAQGAALNNDIDGGMAFWPARHTSTSRLVQVLDAVTMKDTLTEEHFADNPAKDPAAHKRLRTLLENLKEDDNPVIVIAKLKK